MLNFRRVTWPAVVATAILVACQARDLTRDRAKELIETNAGFLSGTRVLAVPWESAGSQNQIVKFDGVNSSQRNMAVQPAYASAVASARQGDRENLHRVYLTLVRPLSPAIQNVTGISDGGSPGEKIVDFQWDYTSPPPDVLKPLVSAPGVGRAVVKRYDDGWRIEQLSWQPDGSS